VWGEGEIKREEWREGDSLIQMLAEERGRREGEGRMEVGII
jgi:hypothetical protein